MEIEGQGDISQLQDFVSDGVSRFSSTNDSGSSGKHKRSLSAWDKFSTVSFTTDAKEDFTEFGTEDHSIMGIIKAEYLTWLIPGAVGFLTAFSGKLIEYLVNLFADLRVGHCPGNLSWKRAQCGADWVTAEALYGDKGAYFYYIAFSTCLATLSAFMTWRFAPMAKGSGIPEIKTILGGFTFAEVLEANTLVVKIFGLALSVGAGLSCGKEGPLVHIACCWSHVLSKFWPRFAKNESKRVEVASCACAAGVAVAFGAPLGGVLFSLEEASTFFPTRTMIRAFFAGACASLVLLQMSDNGKLTMFEATYKSPPSFIEWPIFIFLGVFGGCIGAVFIHFNIIIAKFRAPDGPKYFDNGTKNWRDKVPAVIEVAAIAAITAITSYPFLYTRVMSNATIQALFQNCKYVTTTGAGAIDPATLLGLCSPPGAQQLEGFADSVWTPVLSWEVCWLLAVSGLLRYLQMMITFGCGAPSGLFIPSLYTGACVGRIIGICVFNLNAIFHFSPGQIYPGVYAMLGAAAVLGGVCRVTISLVVIMFELTGGLQMIVPFMIVCITAKAVGDYFTPGIYDYCIIIRKYPFLHEPDGLTFNTKAHHCMDYEALDCLHLYENDEKKLMYTAQSLLNVLEGVPHGGLPITRSKTDHILLGYVHTARLKKFLKTYMDENPLTAPTKKTCFKKYLEGGAAPDAKAWTPEQLAKFNSVLDLSDQVDETVLRVPPSCPAEHLHSYFRLLGVKLVFVVSKGHLKGMITKKCFIDHLETLHGYHDEENCHEEPDSKAAPLLK